MIQRRAIVLFFLLAQNQISKDEGIVSSDILLSSVLLCFAVDVSWEDRSLHLSAG